MSIKLGALNSRFLKVPTAGLLLAGRDPTGNNHRDHRQRHNVQPQWCRQIAGDCSALAAGLLPGGHIGLSCPQLAGYGRRLKARYLRPPPSPTPRLQLPGCRCYSLQAQTECTSLAPFRCPQVQVESLPSDLQVQHNKVLRAKRTVTQQNSYNAESVSLELTSTAVLDSFNVFKSNMNIAELDRLFDIDSDLQKPCQSNHSPPTTPLPTPTCRKHEHRCGEGNTEHAETSLLGDIIQICEAKISEYNADSKLISHNATEEYDRSNPDHIVTWLMSVVPSSGGHSVQAVPRCGGHSVQAVPSCGDRSVQDVLKGSAVCYMSDMSSQDPSHQPMGKSPKNDRPQKPSLDQLFTVRDHLADELPKLFVGKHNYRIYTPDVVLENNYWQKPYSTRGIAMYVYEMAKMRLMAHFTYANVRFHVLKMTTHEEDGSVRVRWRISGIPQSRAFMFWKFLPWQYKRRLDSEAEWNDGFSMLYLDGNGAVYKHRVERVIPDEDKSVSQKASLAEKLHKVLTPKPALGASAS